MTNNDFKVKGDAKNKLPDKCPCQDQNPVKRKNKIQINKYFYKIH